ncbi:MAG: hypothetical protein IJE61_00515 [Bacteroidales bacterium]|nr:hypothetical protein [Bacteroidales bacterium]
MNSILKVFIFFLFTVIFSCHAYSQHKDSTYCSDLEEIQYARFQNLSDAGKTITFTGVGCTVAGMIWILSDYIPPVKSPAVDRLPIGTFLGMITTGVGLGLAIVGGPLWIAGSKMSLRHTGNTMEFSSTEQQGIGMFVNAGYRFPDNGSLGFVCGYHISENLFMGGGTLFSIDPYACYLPLYANVRYTIGAKRTAPYFSVDAGYDFLNMNMYGNLEFGTRIRTNKGKRSGDSWWLGIAGTYLGVDKAVLPSVKAGYSF